MHEVRTPADLDVALDGRSVEGVKQPLRVGVGDQVVPFSTNDFYRRFDQRGIIRQMAGLRFGDLLHRAARNLYTSGRTAARNLYTSGRTAAALRVRSQIRWPPFVKVLPRENRRFSRRNILNKPIPLLLKCDYIPGGKYLGFRLSCSSDNRSEERRVGKE